MKTEISTCLFLSVLLKCEVPSLVGKRQNRSSVTWFAQKGRLILDIFREEREVIFHIVSLFFFLNQKELENFSVLSTAGVFSWPHNAGTAFCLPNPRVKYTELSSALSFASLREKKPLFGAGVGIWGAGKGLSLREIKAVI